MGRTRLSRRLNVFLNGRHVGQFNREASGAIDFVYDPAWLGWAHTLPISLSLPLREERYIGSPVSVVFDNLLPDNDELRRQIATRVGAEGADAYSLLYALGGDCVGALQFLPDGIAPAPTGAVEGRPVSDDEIAAIIANLARCPLGLERDDDFRISIAGAQEKTALLSWNGQWWRPNGATPTTHIFKPQIGQLPNGIDLSNSVENEYLCLTLTRELGIPTANVAMATFGDQRVLVVERFDRQVTTDRRILRVPQEDCCQALSVPWTQKYESDGGPGIPAILKLLAGSDTPTHDQALFFKANIVFWLTGATDGHAKNFSLFLSPGGGYRLTPLYDILSAEPSLAAHQIRHNQMKLAMAVGNSRHSVVKTVAARHFVESAVKGGMGRQAAFDVIDGLRVDGLKGLEQTLAGLPNDFPAAIADAVSRAFRVRLAQLDRVHAAD